MRLDPWQVPVIVMTILAVPVALHSWLKEHRATGERTPGPPLDLESPMKDKEWGRFAVFAVLTLLLIVIFGWALGPTTADKIVTGASAVSAIIAVYLAVKSLPSQVKQPSGTKEAVSNQPADDAGS